MSIAENLERVRNDVAKACARARRSPSSVALMAVSKMHGVEAIREAFNAGQRLFGENRVQETHAKLASLTGLSGMNMHLIGPLQNNKASKAAELFQAVDTLDSLKTAERLNKASAKLGKILPVLVEVKLSTEESKHGIDESGLPDLLASLRSLKNLEVRGLMTVPPWSKDPEAARPYFRRLRQLRDEHQSLCPTLVELSMGMSGDFQTAIEEGSTTVRIGTAIFGDRKPL